jgi:N-terminal domain of (some) glycogen debranching enzymes
VATPDTISILDGATFVVSDAHGDLEAGPDQVHGLFYRDTRFLSRWILTVDGHRPDVLSVENGKYFGGPECREDAPKRRVRLGPDCEETPALRAFRHGASRTRTGDLLGAIQALSQLSYSPAAGKSVATATTQAAARPASRRACRP